MAVISSAYHASSLFRTEKPFVGVPTTESDRLVASIAFGWTIGFTWFVCMHAYQQTRRLSVFTVLIWSEIIACTVFAVICWLYLNEFIRHSFAFYFSILTCWALQVQFLLQIIVNRICLLLRKSRQKFWLKFATAAFITCINITVYCIWIPAKLEISQRYHDINVWWDRCEKVLYLLTDGCLNYIFIRTVQNRLLAVGLKKYDKLVRFNKAIIFLSLSMGGMQFHPIAYIVKLEIEMQMSKLIVKVARGTGVNVMDDDAPNSSTGRCGSGNKPQSASHGRTIPITRPLRNSGVPINVQVSTEVVTQHDKYEERELEMWAVKRDADDASEVEHPSQSRRTAQSTVTEAEESQGPLPVFNGIPQIVHFDVKRAREPNLN